MGFFIMGLLVALGERGVLVLPAMTQDVCEAGEPWSMTPGGDKGVLLLPWMGLGLLPPWKAQGLTPRAKASGLPRGSVLGESGLSLYTCEPLEVGLSMPAWWWAPARKGDLGPGSLPASLCLWYAEKSSCCCWCWSWWWWAAAPMSCGCGYGRGPAAIIILKGFLQSEAVPDPDRPSCNLFLIALVVAERVGPTVAAAGGTTEKEM